MESIESTGKSIEEAIASGMEELQVTDPAQVMVEVLQEPDKGIMGHGARDAIVRLVFMGVRPGDEPMSIMTGTVDMDEDQIPINPSKTEDATPKTIISNYKPTEEDIRQREEARRRQHTESSDEQPQRRKDNRRNKDNSRRNNRKKSDEPFRYKEPEDAIAYDEAEQDAQVGHDILTELLEKMGLETRVYIQPAHSTRNDESTHWILNVKGRNVNRLIGRRGDTLSSLQYIVRLIASRRLERRANIIVDADSYKSKRSDRLTSLANRMADQAVKQQTTITLEPMPPHERRIIHLTLRKRDDVTTRSVGEGNERKVTITASDE